MKTIKLNINCSEETCSVDIYRPCRFLLGQHSDKQTCLLFDSWLENTKEYTRTNTSSFLDCYRCKECKEAEVNQ